MSNFRVAVIGGLSRASHDWTDAGDALGIEVEHHDGRTAGGRAGSLASIVRRADLVITITIPNSHNGVAIARRTATEHGKPFLLVKRLSPNGLAAVLPANARSPAEPPQQRR